MSTRRVLLLQVLVLSALTVHAKRLPGCMCFARSSAQCSPNKDSLAGLESLGLTPIKSPQALYNTVENFARINLACMTPASKFHIRKSVESSGSEASSSPALFGQPWRVSGFVFCNCGSPMQKTTIPDSEMQRVHEETLRNAQKARFHQKPVDE